MADNKIYNELMSYLDSSRADQGAIEANYDRLHDAPQDAQTPGREVRLADIRAKYAKRRQYP